VQEIKQHQVLKLDLENELEENMYKALITFKQQCKIKIHIVHFCVGIGTDQLTPHFHKFVTEELIRRYDNPQEFRHQAGKADVVPFCKQKLNYGRRKRHAY
jgi:hypothetical protein